MKFNYFSFATFCFCSYTTIAVAQIVFQTEQNEINVDVGSHTPYREFNYWINSFFFSQSTISWFTDRLGADYGHYLVTYLRDLLAAFIVYYLTAGVWHWYIYVFQGKKFFPDGDFPTKSIILDQIMLAQCSMFLYAMLPVLAEWFIEMGFTQCYYYISEIGGWKWYIFYTFLYLCFVEVGVYWVHRKLHTNKFLYKYVHALHHKYNTPNDLTPWASIAFNPIDGICQASPYVIGLFIVPCHYLTHVLMLFFTAIWATNIHDALIGNYEPIMGSKYHTIHHTHYHYNFGQFFIFCDQIFGTFRTADQIKIRRRKMKK